MAPADNPQHETLRVALGAARLRVGLAFVLILLLVLGVRLFQVQGLDPDGMAQVGLNKRLVTQQVPALRGSILDDEGNELAHTVQRFDIVVDQTLSGGETFDRYNRETGKRVEDIPMEQGFEELSTILGEDVATLKSSILGDAKFAFVARSVTPDIRNQVLAVGMPGVYADPTTLRTYPSGAVAGSILGFMSGDGRALSGIELTQEEQLTGTPGSRTFEIGGDGIRIPYATNEDVPAQDGQSVRLTIDQDLQYFAQQTIAAQVEDYNAEWGNIVVVEAKTGAIKAMAESTTPDPNDYAATAPEFWKPLSVTASFEPGSTTKLITMAAALEEGIIEPTSRFETPPTYTVDGQTFKDAFEHGTEKRTAAGIFAKSMNTGTVMIGEQLSKQQRYDWLRKFGIGEPLNVGLNGETAGILPTPDSWDERQQYTVLFGQGLAQTALHTAMVYQAVANDGVRLQPRLIDAYIDADGTEHVVPQAEGTRVVSQETADQLHTMLETVTVEGSGASGALEQYRVGSKTGTAEAPSPQGGYDGYTLSYAGMAPMEDPQYIVVVTLQRPQGDLYYLVPGESFQKVMKYVLNSNNIPPSTGKPETYPVKY
ncbi:penicillin-binding protein 2 [Arthrobacter sp. EH-1B-1]|uniref:Penicillin-binding protein 2 n=1 Tax=Arthrobacter vasquezii TaxID=2977629 RepID=A0ABT6CUT8_9MICC|nr:penicillin-binding protein 2 [Arthrobacter vasquezii]MDF9277257.1 penicillin-binding protein 2 [Arthrobacter vasquezii]